jgi:hypothetical protein
MRDMAKVWKGRAEGLADSLQEIWERGVGFNGLPGFDRTRPKAEQITVFNKRFRPWLQKDEAERLATWNKVLG